MVRFCDKEVAGVEYAALNRRELLSYFLSGHIDEMIMVYDSFDTMGYMGYITYQSLLRNISISSAIHKDYLILDGNIWNNARKYFDEIDKTYDMVPIIPVINEECRVICFAYEDDDANREIRMLRELLEQPEALQFTDIYPEYQCVKIYGFNELAYFFAIYLRSQNIAVQVDGIMWQNFFDGDTCEVSEYACLTIYAEGVAAPSQDLMENLFRSVSVEFECIDKIYEMGIQQGAFKNANGGLDELLERLRIEKEIIIMGCDIEAQKVYGFLKKNGIDICCFMGQQNHKIFGKEILNRADICNIYKTPVYIECNSIGSAWGGIVDYFDYMGYERNKQFVMLRDYVEIPDKSLVYAVENQKVALVGDYFLCKKLSNYLYLNGAVVTECLEIQPKKGTLQKLSDLQQDGMREDVTWLIVTPRVYDENVTWKTETEQALSFCRENEIRDYTDSFSYMGLWLDIETKKAFEKEWLMPNRIVIGAIEDHCGNDFFRSLLDGHPSILMIRFYGALNNNLFWICVALSVLDAKDILPAFWDNYEKIATETIYNKNKFNEKMKQLLIRGDKFTSQELFVIFHIAYMYMCSDIGEVDIRSMVIYWEAHYMPREILEDCVKWLAEEGKVPCSIINMPRNICMKMGSKMKDILMLKRDMTKKRGIWQQSIEKKHYDNVDRLIVRFEDLKCNPKETLLNICDKWGISWSESLMSTTQYGKKLSYDNGIRMISDFDLEPVYNTYEKFFSEFDRLRIQIINAPWQRKYGYPYVELANFSRRELQEMFLKPFRFEERSEDNKKLELSIQKIIRKKLRYARRLECEQSGKMAEESRNL